MGKKERKADNFLKEKEAFKWSEVNGFADKKENDDDDDDDN